MSDSLTWQIDISISWGFSKIEDFCYQPNAKLFAEGGKVYLKQTCKAKCHQETVVNLWTKIRFKQQVLWFYHGSPMANSDVEPPKSFFGADSFMYRKEEHVGRHAWYQARILWMSRCDPSVPSFCVCVTKQLVCQMPSLFHEFLLIVVVVIFHNDRNI